LLVNPVFDSLELRSGDLLLARGSSFVSAAIARIGDEDGQFSHLVMMYIADNGGRYIMESSIKSGVEITPLEKWLSHGSVRLVVFRHQDGQFAERVAQELYDWVVAAKKAGRRIPYDYRMDTPDHSELYCAELVSFAYERTSGGRARLPVYPTSLRTLQGHPFLKNMGIRGPTTFAPSDVELDPQLRLVAEWRDLRYTAETRIKDAILSSVLDWMADRNYQLTYRGLLQGILDIYWTSLRPLGVLKNKLPANMGKAFMKNLLGLNSVANLVYQCIAPPLLRAAEENPLALDYKAILAAIEEYRLRDCLQLRKDKRWHRENPVNLDDEDEPFRAELHYLIGVPGASSCPLGD